MKHISYSFSNSDIEAITFALTVLPSLGIEETEAQAAINYQCCCSAGEKLLKHDTNIAPNEFRVILASLQAVQLINQGELEVDQETKQKCSSYLFTVNIYKLPKSFGGFFSVWRHFPTLLPGLFYRVGAFSH